MGDGLKADDDEAPEDEVLMLFLEIPIPPEEAARVLLGEYGEGWCRELVAALVRTTLPLESLFSEWGNEEEAAGLDGDDTLPAAWPGTMG